jgi:acetate---CoA ligase (ADP-forming)
MTGGGNDSGSGSRMDQVRQFPVVSERPTLDRLFRPSSIAIVGVSESSTWAPNVRFTLESGADVYLVHPKATEIFGMPVYPSLMEIDAPVDVVFSAVSAATTVDIASQAADIGAGAFIAIAGGFAEAGSDGVGLQEDLVAAASRGHFPVVGPNGVGIVNLQHHMDLSMLPLFERRAGGLAVITHSGAMAESIGAAAHRSGGVGFSLLISAGNEAVTDVADYLQFLSADAETRVIALAIEKIRRPEAFFDAAAACLAAGKPIFALKLGRFERSQRMAASHTGTLTGDSWIYDVAFEQAGIQAVRDVDELVDRTQVLEQLSPKWWTPVRGLAVLTASGGFAALASDIAEVEGVDVPELEALRPFVKDRIPGGSDVPNPLDATGFIASMPTLWDDIIAAYSLEPEVDTLVFASQHADWDLEGRGRLEQFIEGVAVHGKPAIVGTLAGNGGGWLDEYRKEGVAITNGLGPTMRAIASMSHFVRTPRDRRVLSPSIVPTIAEPISPTIRVGSHRMLPFDATMDLLRLQGFGVAPFQLIRPDESVSQPSFAGPYAVKLADLAHRTEHDAVRLGVSEQQLGDCVAELRELARMSDLPTTVVVQPYVKGIGEAFIGIQGAMELGPAIAFGQGGIFVETQATVGGLLAPFDEDVANEFLDRTVYEAITGFRNQTPWPRKPLIDTLMAAGRLAAGGRAWIESIDINPLVVVAGEQPQVVDALCFMRP